MIGRRVWIQGGGDLASGVAVRLYRAGFVLVMTELAQPMVVRRTVSFAQAVLSGWTRVEGITARLADSPAQVLQCWAAGEIPILVEPEPEQMSALGCRIVVDARMRKKEPESQIRDEEIRIGLGPGFRAGWNCHAVVETLRGHSLGKVLYHGCASPDTRVPALVAGYGQERVIRAPGDGVFHPVVEIGDVVEQGQVLAQVGMATVQAGISGVVRGMLAPGTTVTQGMKAGDIDPRGERSYCFQVSDKSLAVAGGCLEAIFCLSQGQARGALGISRVCTSGLDGDPNHGIGGYI